MKRKLVKQGNSALTITVPNAWVKKFNLKPGDEVEVEESGKGLLVTNEKDYSQHKVTMQLSADPDLAKRQIGFAYKKGVDELEVTFEDPGMGKVIHEKLNDFLGFEIVSQSKNRCVIKNIASQNEEDLDNILRRSILVTLQLAEESYEYAKNKKTQALDELLYLERMNNKLTDFCKRVLNKRGYHQVLITTLIYRIVVHLEQIGDSYREIIHTILANSDREISSQILQLFKETNMYLREFSLVFNTKREEDIQKFLLGKKILQLKIKNATEPDNVFSEQLLGHYQNVIQLCFDMGGPFYETLL